MTALLSLALTLAPAEPVAVPIVNAGFEQGQTGWSLPAGSMGEISGEQAHTGSHSLKITDTSDKAGSNVTSAAIASAGPGSYRLSGQALLTSGSGLGVYVQQFEAGGRQVGGQDQVSVGAVDRGWQRFELRFVVGRETSTLRIWVHSYNGALVTGYLDDLELSMVPLDEAALEADLVVIKERLTARELSRRPNPAAARQLIESLQPDGTWPDIDYAQRGRTLWAPAGHVDRILTMATAWRVPGSELAGDEALLAAIWRAFDAWVRLDPQCDNWWYNVIGVPRTMYRALLLLDPVLSLERRAQGLAILERARVGMTGQNLVWVAEVTVARGCLAGDPWPTQVAFTRMADEAVVTTNEGVQVDGMFYQHGQQIYNGGYGKGFSVDTPEYAALAAGTGFAFPEANLAVLSGYLLDGQQWLIRGPRIDYSVTGRELSRSGGGHSGGILRGVESLLAAGAPRADELAVMAQRLRTGEPPLVGNRHFWRGDLMSHHRPGFYASVRLTSPRLIQTEVTNAENLLGRHLADGVAYLYRTGNEYFQIFGVWDWQKLPGATIEQHGDSKTRNGTRGERDFAGGVSDGQSGLAAMDFQAGGLSARKAWFFCGDSFLALGAQITCESAHPVVTTLNQCNLTGTVSYEDATGRRQAGTGQVTLTRPRWVHHDEVGYVLLNAPAAVLSTVEQTGSWRRINQSGSDQPLRQPVFGLWLDHGPRPAGADYAYLVLPGAEIEATAAAAGAPPYQVLVNQRDQQAAWHEASGTFAAACYVPGEVASPLGPVGVDRACLLLLARTAEGLRLTVSQPAAASGELVVTLPGRWRGEGARVTGERTTVSVMLPAGALAGSSVIWQGQPEA